MDELNVSSDYIFNPEVRELSNNIFNHIDDSNDHSDDNSNENNENDLSWRPFKRIFPQFSINSFGNQSESPKKTKLKQMPSPITTKKSTEERLKYQKEYEIMVKNFQEKERKKEKERKRYKEMREQRITECNRIWKESDYISNWELRKSSKKLRELISRGIPPNIRSSVWPLLIGNRLQITPELFDIYVAQATRTRELAGKEIGKESSLKVIDLDLPRTFPALSFFQPEGPLHSQLRQVLEAYVSYRPDIGYVQGMSFLASMLLLVMDTYDAFKCLANLLNRPFFLGFYRLDINHIDKFAEVFEHLLSIYLPQLYDHFTHHNITPHIYSMDWVLTLYSKTLPLDTCSRLWDYIFMDNEICIFRIGLALLDLSKNEILACSYENTLLILTHFPQHEEEEVLNAMLNYPITLKTDKKLEAYLQSISI